MEVSKDIDLYLPDEVLNIVDWTGGLCDAAGDATMWLFVYLRFNELMGRYLKALGKGAVQSIICLNSKADHEDLDALMQHYAWEKEIITESGFADYEMLIHWQKHQSISKHPVDTTNETHERHGTQMEPHSPFPPVQSL